MNSYFALIGPGKKVASMAKNFLKNKEKEKHPGHLIAVTITDGHSLSLNIPQYFSWQEMLAHHHINVIINLDHDPALKQELRQNLSPEIDIVENIPGQLLHTLFLVKSVHKQKAEGEKTFLNHLVQTLPFATIIFDPHGRVVYWNKHCEQLTEVKAENVLGKKDVGFAFYYDQRPLVGQLILENLDHDSLRQLFSEQDIRIEPFPDGVQISGFMPFRSRIQGYYQVTAIRIIERRKILGSIQLIHDLNSLNLLKNQLRNQQEILQNILLKLPFPLIHTNLKGDIFFTNKAAQDTFLSLFKKKKTKNLFRLVPEILAHVSDYLADFEIGGHLATELSQNFILELDSDQWDVTCIFIPDEQNQNTAIIWILRNITMEETQNRLNAALAMSGAISHELAQPLTAIVNSAQLLANTGAKNIERIKRHQKIITAESERIFKIYRKLQNLTQFKVQNYLDTQILNLEESSAKHSDFTFPESSDS